MRAHIDLKLITCVMATGLPLSAAAHAQSDSLSLQKTAPVCDLLGLGAVGTVPYNFPGIEAERMSGFRFLNPGIVERSLPAGENAKLAPVVGGDLGAPFLHSDGKLYFSFGDAWFDSSRRIDGAPTRIVNDDVLASTPLKALPDRAGCMPLEIPTASNEITPITWNGSGATTGHALGSGMVPGPGFSTGAFMFMLMTDPPPSCASVGGKCSEAGGLPEDVCVTNPQGGSACQFGPCGPGEPCALRLSSSTLVIQRDGSGTDFTEPKVGEHIASKEVLNAYRGHFSVVTFHSTVDFATGEGKVWVLGRDSFWGMPGLPMSPYLMYHPVQQGMLGKPIYFTGLSEEGSEPLWSEDRADAKPLYEESLLATQHSSFTYVPELLGGVWLMLYGGHAQTAMRSLISIGINPVVDELFYARDGGVKLRWAKQPWGPWSEPIALWNPYVRGQGGYCEQMHFDDPQHKTDFTCPADSHNNELNRSPGMGLAGAYGVGLIPGTGTLGDGDYSFSWLVSTWNPYRVLQMRSTLRITSAPAPETSPP